MISVVMAVRNEERLLGRAIRSILDQSWEDLEFIVVDNGSTDGTRGELEEWSARDPRIRAMDEPVPGAHCARNRGLREATRPWIAIQDADDVSHPRRLATLLGHVTRRPRTVLVGSWAVVYSEREGLREPLHHATSDFGVRCQLRTGPSPFVHSSVLYRRQDCLEVGGYPAGFSHSEDYALWCLLSRRGCLANVPEHLVVYRHQDRDPDSRFRAEEREETGEIRRRFLRPGTRWDEWALRLSRDRRQRNARERLREDWPSPLLARFGLEELFQRRAAPQGSV